MAAGDRGQMILCANSRCRILGRHATDCEVVDCRGCLPRPTAAGTNLCEVCTRRLAEDAITAGVLYADLELVLTSTGVPGEPVSGTSNPGTEINPRAVECRTLIRHTLVSWTLLVTEERGITTPDDVVEQLAAFVATHAVWLSAHPAAGDCAEELHELAHGQPWRTAYPSGARRFPVGACPLPCPGVIVAVLRDTDYLLPSALTCDTDESHTWSADSWRALGRALHPDGMAGRYVTATETAATWRRPLGTIYRLASVHAWTRTADNRKPTLYLAADVDATMRLTVRSRSSRSADDS
jgi:hypothetical protein